MISFLLLLLVAGICGSIGRAIAGGPHSGCLGSIAVGFIGALLGLALARWLNLPELFAVVVAGVRFPVIWSVAGSAIFVAILTFFTRSGSRRDFD